MSPLSASHKVALITGAGGGLGSNLAPRLAGEGYAVALHYLGQSAKAAEARDSIVAQGGRAELFQADLADPQETESMVLKAMETFGGQLDLLVNAAGTYKPIKLEELRPEDWFAGFHSTATAAFLTTRCCLPYLRRQTAARVINLGDSSADRATARDLALGYHIGKTGVWMLTRSFAQAEAVHGLTVNMISPGFLENSVPGVDLSEIPAGRTGTYDDIWVAIKFLIREDTSYLTGTDLMVSGGWNLR